MKTVKVKKDTLKHKIEDNLNLHRSTYKQALENFRSALIRRLERMLKDAAEGKQVEMYISMPVPEEHSRDYERALAMLEMEVEDVVEISETRFAELVMNEWGWREAFAQNTLSYLSTEET